MPEKPLHVAFLWHQHQPYYRDLMTGESLMPWARLHGVKDYLDMVLLLDEFPAMRMNINLVPSLVEQLEAYAAGETTDPWLQVAERPAADLTEEEKVFLLRRFFAANHETMIEPHERYGELLRRRGWSKRSAELARRARTWDERDWRDLQVWFHLAWTDPLLVERDEALQSLIAKGRDFTEEDKALLLERQRAILAEIVPAHRRLQDKGRLEVTTTPHCHPILPLLCDTNWAKEALPKIALPKRRHRHPEDARGQVESALAFMTGRMGAPPRGMWPSEGSVCPEIVPILAEAGVRWIATDEEVLAKSLGVPLFHRDRRGRVNDMDALYRPYGVEVDGHRLDMVFRDHVLSDFMGFEAASAEPQAAAKALLDRLTDIRVHLRGAEGPHLVSIILDGENCWEFYGDDGLPFLRALYGGLSDDPLLVPVRIGDFLEEHPPDRTLSRLHAGSWINHNFAIWIGHPEDNLAWDHLTETRGRVMAHIEENRESLSEEQIALALKAIAVAQGSDWNWWYGDDHNSGMDDLFDDLYRRHLAAAHRAVGLEPAAHLQMSITSEGETGVHTPPQGYLEIEVDGRETHFFEWSAAGHYDPQHGGGAMHRAEEVVKGLRYGFSRTHLALRVDLLASVWDRVGDEPLVVEFLVHEPTPLRLSAALPPSGEAGKVELTIGALDNGPEPRPLPEGEAAWDQILEVRVPWETLKAAPGDRLLLQAVVSAGGQELDRVPSRAPISTRAPDDEWEAMNWVV